ncbi:restriction endonuclease [Nitrosopumilus sp. K4]|uniref:restriction endonuclease n=1 Tax=Nitrosopumilus sp. K4 TaxID=2795383 RepID=UPI00201301D1|nr:restriction endonuclease [Nitrosopumilus sp. K4]
MSTIMRAGASRNTAKRILKKVKSEVYRDMTSNDIYKKVLHAIAEEKGLRALHQRYQLKDSIMRMGPAGFAFENYIASLLEYYDYQVSSIRSKIHGKCASHEIDLVASRGQKEFLVECKYHSSRGIYTGLKVALYTHARFLDLQPKFAGEIIFCNTKISTNAKKYAKCIGQQVVSWRYPVQNSLEKIIEEHDLYPITILNLTQKELQAFSENNIMIAKDLLRYDDSKIAKITGVSKKRISNLQKLVKQIFNPN